jgi:hypothetical protein
MTEIDGILSERKVFTRADLVAAGFTRHGIVRAMADGRLVHPSFGTNGPELGLLVTPDAEDDPDLPEAAVCHLTGGILCRGYAAARHGLSNDMPGIMEITVPARVNPGPRPYLRVHRTRDEKLLTVGVEDLPTGLGVPIRITNRVRTVLDLLRSRGRVGEEWRHGIDSLRTYLGEGGDTEELYDMARQFESWLLPTIETAAEAFNGGGPRR